MLNLLSKNIDANNQLLVGKVHKRSQPNKNKKAPRHLVEKALFSKVRKPKKGVVESTTGTHNED